MPSWIDFVWAYAKQFGITKLRWVIPGGETGQESIYNGIKELEKECELSDVVMIHDGNRPMISDDIIADSLSIYKKLGSAVAAIPCVEAVFRSEDGISSQDSIPREKLFRTQTPHTYSLEKILWAHGQAKILNITNTAASCTLMQQLGEKIYFSKGSEKNFKLTTVEDFDIFRAFLHDDEPSWIRYASSNR